MPTYRHCRACGVHKGPKGGGYCDKPECREIARQNQARSPRKIAASKERMHRRWEEWWEQGINPTATPEALRKKGPKIAVSNRQKPRRKRKEKPDG